MRVILLALSMIWIASKAVTAQKVSSAEFLKTRCARFTPHYEPLVRSQLDSLPYEVNLADILRRWPPDHPARSRLSDEAHGWPALYIIDGELFADKSLQGRRPLFNLDQYALPVLGELTNTVRFPDMALLYGMFDEPPVRRSQDEPGPWFGYCGVKQDLSNLLIPSELSDTSEILCKDGLNCSLGDEDTRQGRAVFIGSQTGWARGRRRAVFLAGITSKHRVHARVKNAPGVFFPDTELMPALESHESMSLEDQVSHYRYVVHVEGNCAALRLKDLLASPSAVMKVTSEQDEWFSPLLKPYKHYIPVSFEVSSNGSDYSVNLADQVEWAETHREAVAMIVKNANIFAKELLSKEGKSCYTALLLHEYAQVQRDPWSVRDQRNNMVKAEDL